MYFEDFIDKDLVDSKVLNVIYVDKIEEVENDHDFIVEKIEDEIIHEDEKERIVS